MPQTANKRISVQGAGNAPHYQKEEYQCRVQVMASNYQQKNIILANPRIVSWPMCHLAFCLQGLYIHTFLSRPIDDETGFDKETPKREPEPTQEDQQLIDKMKQTFFRVAGSDEEIDAFELREILNVAFKEELQGEAFSTDVCRSLVAMYDGDLSGKLGCDEFAALWSELRVWKGVFKKYDHDSSGHFSSYELRQALHATGFRVSNKVLGGITARFNNKNGHIMFDDFISCLARLKTMISKFLLMLSF
ncbi:calpain-a [Plakobranchus ocellatus]|uniref:Calpain-a n=1 Tax=Plakobranchus ocellatus TaxID=259542 RepID=A0AAV4CUR3_9GAST|nr:calpain-a [Plakobranchus ocellatus]